MKTSLRRREDALRKDEERDGKETRQRDFRLRVEAKQHETGRGSEA